MKSMLSKKNSSSKFSEELRAGLRETSKYILSHHRLEDHWKCFSVLGQPVCSRCLGIYLGIFFGLGIYFFQFLSEFYYLMILFLPLPMLINWFLTTTGKTKSSNLNRAGTGFLCGTAYSLGVIHFFAFFPNIQVVFIGLVYGLLAIGGLIHSRKQ